METDEHMQSGLISRQRRQFYRQSAIYGGKDLWNW